MWWGILVRLNRAARHMVRSLPPAALVPCPTPKLMLVAQIHPIQGKLGSNIGITRDSTLIIDFPVIIRVTLQKNSEVTWHSSQHCTTPCPCPQPFCQLLDPGSGIFQGVFFFLTSHKLIAKLPWSLSVQILWIMYFILDKNEHLSKATNPQHCFFEITKVLSINCV